MAPGAIPGPLFLTASPHARSPVAPVALVGTLGRQDLGFDSLSGQSVVLSLNRKQARSRLEAARQDTHLRPGRLISPW